MLDEWINSPVPELCGGVAGTPFEFCKINSCMSEEASTTISLKTAGSTIATIVAILGAFWALDNHYASAADVAVLQRSLETQVRSLRQERVEDELFKLDMKKQAQKGKLSPEDEALYQRYLRKITQTVLEQKTADEKPTKK